MSASSTESHRHPEFRKNRAIKQRAFKPGYHRCGFCSEPIASREDMVVDHEVPVSQGGGHGLDNLRYAHQRCNSAGIAKPALLRYTPPGPMTEPVPRLPLPDYLRD
jgi:5-methylcytosine-specific restriction endonuclease McrA